MNEELQSTNEELQTVNEELRTAQRGAQPPQRVLQSVLASLSAGAVVVNSNLDVLMWNHRAEDLWGLRADEVQGKGLLNLDIGLPVAELRAVIRPAWRAKSTARKWCSTRSTAAARRSAAASPAAPLVAGSKKREGVILMMEESWVGQRCPQHLRRRG